MDAWTGHDVPTLPDSPARSPLRLYDTARASAQPSTPAGSATMYVCGITPYDATHLGHAATMITFDLVNRMWRDLGNDVRYVQNVTDIDDPLLERAERDGEDWIVLAMRETALFREDMEALRIIPPAHYVGAVESIPRIVEHVVELVGKGAAYQLGDGTGDVYFDISAAPRFGYESHLSRDEMTVLSAERGGDPDRAGKRDPLDPLLWRGARDGEPVWDGGEVGPGRPGWHIECATIALRLLGDTIDVQGGGSDLLYPHHECSAAHAEVLTGAEPFAAHYVHAGMIGLDGEKMSKSRGNLVFVSRLRGDGVDPMAVRLGLLSGHYRADRDWTDDVLKQGQSRLARWREASAAPSGPSGAGLLAAVREALADDLDAPAALSLVDAWAEAALAGVGDDIGAPELMTRTVDALLGVRL
ncbi:L-cysteine:1D-myo-inositol 2-amino-2-deoxy-alpha-D-glucopyranoside ligase [Actinoplanes lobatus]|uniref:L-cysteine:1D-myo-inositol 2-amino-2-deoxy-alpha-D-glucopyranoside ligase n=1 Tax=Actinoplanes lobatus TaxID=113568 RepID=A0A7W7MLT5_9ACTN|nr:cysteine--1-D-myo-inosityl 2-amino-2-deoxy-alpha-D-glucopyranoside ligase [Actinoplanes lobatus]MBB4754666.1 L-cysteine:1D-myo-inositol 2-amino-2-deoxy-alpha-D-glucopyranoside ligase [Actinoplanes lobatus]GGN66790.1 L-cysteine:1D-myo-inositol 2-amino-2-deoxy-alpha-D-glucopyranoside ligase [Actinoplanes lobatus]GIE42481.1 L-cysteine:1D-myo-inositol 2-amino-2-deoxy-alpha-D-glucopyranoside ligase [Actinoplanes lobatus]